MSDFRGFDDWVEIFRGGRQTDSNGRTHDGNRLIERAVRSFDTTKHEPPIVVGHPKDNAPAFGWVEKLKTATKGGQNILLGKFKQVVPEFAALAEKGLYKKRSASFYPDGRLRHVGFLGAAPPAVKGLADLKFEDSEETVFNFEDPTGSKEGKMTFKEFMEVFKFWKEVEKNPDLEIPSTTRAKEAPAGFTEADMEAAKTKAADEAAKAEREKVEAEFAEEARDAAREAREEAISEWCDDMVEKGRLTPSLVKYGVPEMLSFMAAKDDLVEFGETKDKATLYDRFKGLFETELPKLVEFNEIATRDKDVSGDDSEKREKLVSEFMERESCDYKTAVLGVSEKHPELFKGGDRS